MWTRSGMMTIHNARLNEMIERQAGQVEMICDECLDPFGGAYDADDFTILIADARAMGWKVQKTGKGEWQHTCPDCCVAARRKSVSR